MARLVLLDRDGVINKDRREGILKREWFEFLPRAIDAIALLKQSGFTIAICTNRHTGNIICFIPWICSYF